MMNIAIKSLIQHMLVHRIMGGKHKPEDQLIRSKTKWLDANQQKDFEKEYKDLVNQLIIMRFKKRTGKSDDWHISLNPRKLREIGQLLELK